MNSARSHKSDYSAYGLGRWSLRKNYYPRSYVRVFWGSLFLAEALLVISVIIQIIGWRIGGVGSPLWVFGVILSIIGFSFMYTPFLKWSRLGRLKTKVRMAGGLLCMRCQYELSDQPEGRCPECGARYDHALLREAWGRTFGYQFKPSDQPGDHLRRKLSQRSAMKPEDLEPFLTDPASRTETHQ